MVQVFQSFVYILFVVGSVLGIGFIFEDKFIMLEDKFDAWVFEKYNIKLPFGKE